LVYHYTITEGIIKLINKDL
jgi:hypothetical protein